MDIVDKRKTASALANAVQPKTTRLKLIVTLSLSHLKVVYATGGSQDSTDSCQYGVDDNAPILFRLFRHFES